MKRSSHLLNAYNSIAFCMMPLAMASCDRASPDASDPKCQYDRDCGSGFICQLENGEAVGVCVPDPCAACVPLRERCDERQCVPVYPYCNRHDDCRSGEYCDQVYLVCVALNGDQDADDSVAGDTADDDGDDAENAEDDVPAEITGEDDAVTQGCQGDGDCPAGYICTGLRTCIPGCVLDNSLCDDDFGSCNPRNYHCEDCDPMCDPGETCNYHVNAWYCGTPCEPPCPDGYACSGGSCVELRCPGCPSGYYCDFSTGYVCKRACCLDGDTSQKAGSGIPRPVCIPGMGECRMGIDSCCSGVCFEGHCM